MDERCTAARHLTVRAYRNVGCRCPAIVERMRAQWRRDYQMRHLRRRREPVYVDEVAVFRAMRGDPVELNPAERREAVRQLARQGYSAKRIAGLLRVAPRTVFRHLAAA